MDGDELAAMAQRLDHGYNQVDKLYYEVARAMWASGVLVLDDL